MVIYHRYRTFKRLGLVGSTGQKLFMLGTIFPESNTALFKVAEEADELFWY